MNFLKKGNVLKAKESFYQFYKQNPKSYYAPHALYQYIKLQSNLQTMINNLSYLKRNYIQFSRSDDVYNDLGDIYFITHQYDKSFFHYKQISIRFPKSKLYPKAIYYLTLIHLIQGQLNELRRFAKSKLRSIKNTEYYEKVLFLVGESFYSENKYNKSILFYKSFLKHRPYTPLKNKIYLKLSQCYSKIHENKKSRQYLALSRKSNSETQEESSYIRKNISTSNNPSESRPKQIPSGKYLLRLGYFAKYSNAIRLKNKVKSLGLSCQIFKIKNNNKILYKPIIGGYSSKSEALEIASLLKHNKIDSTIVLK